MQRTKLRLHLSFLIDSMDRCRILALLVVPLLLGAGCAAPDPIPAPSGTPSSSSESSIPSTESSSVSSTPSTSSESSTDSESATRAPAVVTSFAAGDVIESPLTITGQARGFWFFEASFPIDLENASGDVIASSLAQASGEWMTEDFVPFSSKLIFPKQVAGSTGTLVLHKDDPSGIRPDEVRIPVTF